MAIRAKDVPGTLPDHEWCTTHRFYKLGCHQYEYLLERSGRFCEICGMPGSQSTCGKLHIDHYGHHWAVRGLLCNTCNTKLGRGAFPGSETYLANAWWKQECARVGVATTMMPEPEMGSAIRDQWNVIWLREGDRKWRPRGQGKPGISWASWKQLYEWRGPQNMASFDVYGPGGNEWLQQDAERAMVKALFSWTDD